MPDAFAALAYDATHLVAKAIATAGPTRPAIRTYLSNLTEMTAFHGVAGVTRFATTNDPVGDHFRITHVQHGLLIPVGGR
jgi:ABC-type branched-subunit amino acid transport system substrate-binding protein